MPTERGHILIVDDNKINRMLLARALEAQGHTVGMAEHGLQALELLRDGAEQSDQPLPFDLVLLDILMPELDGYQTLARIKEDPALRHLPVIMITDVDEIDSVVRCIEMGAEDYLPKVFNPVILRARINACLEKKRLRDQEQLYLKGLERELEIGREIQASFLPDDLPQPEGWEIAAYFRAAREVAGDFYDAFTLATGGEVGLVIADVCDKGVGAALFMTLFRSLIRATSNLDYFTGRTSLSAALNRSDEQPSTLADRATNLRNSVALTNNYIARTHGKSMMFATLFFGVLNPVTGSFIYMNGGHEPPVIFNADGPKEYLTLTGPPVGLVPDMEYGFRETRLEPGDTLLAITDGVIDARDVEGKFFSRERLLSLLEQPAASASSLLARIEADLHTHSGGAEQFDDITMLAVRRKA